MRVLLAPDSMKESLSAVEVAQAMARGLARGLPAATLDPCPIADGGEGTVDAMTVAWNARPMVTEITHLRFPDRRLPARWARCDRNGERWAVIETAAAAGLTLLPPGERDPTLTSTFGLGELLRAAMDEGATRILIGLGGSATCDGGCGMAQALGARFFDTAGELIPPPIRGGQLTSIARIELDGMDRRLERTTCLAACDVTNPLLGPAGAARVYAPQKGAGPDQVAALEAGLARLAAVMQRDLDSRDLAAAPGAGAAGGLGAGVLAWLHGELRSGIDMVLDAVGFDQRLRRADVCLTAEGKLDRQSASGKAIAGVARRCRRHAAPLLALVGRSELSPAEALELGLSGVIEIGHGLSAETSMRDADRLTAEASERLAAARFHAR